MFCTKCGVELEERAKFCSQCGVPTVNAPAPVSYAPVRLSRPLYDRKIAGVCSGFARYLSVDVTLVRIVAIVLLLWPVPLVGMGIAYLTAWIVMPNDPIALPAPAQTAS